MADAAAGVRVRDLDELGEGVLAVTLDVRRQALGDRPQHAVDHEAAVVVAGQVGLDDDRAGAALAARGGIGRANRVLIGQVQHHAAPVVAVERLHGDRVADALSGRDRGVRVADDLRARDRHAGRRQQLVRQLLVRGDVDAERPGAARHRRPDPLLVDAVAELDERLVVEADRRDIAQRRLVEEGLGRGPERESLGEQDQPFELGSEVEGRIGLDEVVDEAHGELAGGHADALLRVRVDDVVQPRLAGPAGLAAADLRARLALELERDVLGDMPDPGALVQPIGEAADAARCRTCAGRRRAASRGVPR